jgi:hypothetical protein
MTFVSKRSARNRISIIQRRVLVAALLYTTPPKLNTHWSPFGPDASYMVLQTAKRSEL